VIRGRLGGYSRYVIGRKAQEKVAKKVFSQIRYKGTNPLQRYKKISIYPNIGFVKYTFFE
jgi:hypothetical protein